MDLVLFLINRADETPSEGDSQSGSSEQLMEALKNMVKSPIFYIVIGLIVLLIVAFYLYRRVTTNREGNVTLVVRKGEIYKTLEGNNEKYFLVPFVDRVGAVISLKEKEFSSDKLFINNGPDALYKVNFTIKYKVTDPKEFYKFYDKIDNLMLNKLNEDLREFADKGNAMVLVKDYRENSNQILELMNKALEEYFVEVLSFKINLIEPLGKN